MPFFEGRVAVSKMRRSCVLMGGWTGGRRLDPTRRPGWLLGFLNSSKYCYKGAAAGQGGKGEKGVKGEKGEKGVRGVAGRRASYGRLGGGVRFFL